MFLTVLKKEAKHLINDKGFILMALIEPIVFIIMFGSSFQGGDINHLETIVIDKDNSVYSQYVIDAVDSSEFFDIAEFSDSLHNSLVKLNNSEVRAVIYIPMGFKNRIDSIEAGEIKIFIDSSNFLTYSSLSSAKVEIAKNSLQNITEDILNDLEKEKEDGKNKIEEVKSIIEKIEEKTDKLDRDLEDIQGELNESSVAEIEDVISDIKSSLEKQKENLRQADAGFEEITEIITDLKVNQSEEYKKSALTSQIYYLRENLNSSSNRIDRTIKDIEEFEIPYLEKDAENLMNNFEDIEERFRDIQDKIEGINFEFEKLEKKFLSEPLIMDETAIHGPIKYFDYLGAGVLSLIVFFVCVMAPSLNIISEKEKNTLYRISTTPASSTTIFLGKFAVFLIFGFIMMVYTLLLSIFLYDLRITGSVLNVVIILFLLACSSISIGLFISSKVRTMQQALVVVPLIVIPSFLISHAFFPPDIMAEFMNYVAYATPMTFSNHALNSIMIKGFSLSDVIVDILALLGYTIVPLVLFIWSYKKIKY